MLKTQNMETRSSEGNENFCIHLFLENINKMNKEVLLFAEDIIVDNKPLVSSGQGQVFFGYCPRKKERIVIK